MLLGFLSQQGTAEDGITRLFVKADGLLSTRTAFKQTHKLLKYLPFKLFLDNLFCKEM